MMKLAVFVSHPIQYQVPIWRHLCRSSEFEARVFFFSDHGLLAHTDPDFNREVEWDVPLLKGINHKFLSRAAVRDLRRQRIPNLSSLRRDFPFDAALVHGYNQPFARQIIMGRRRFGYRVVLHGEFSDVKRHSNLMKRLVREIYLKWLYRSIDKFVAIGSESREHLVKRGVDQDRIAIAPYSVDTDMIDSQKRACSRDACRRALGIDSTAFVVMFSGKFIPRKQPHLLADVVCNLRRSNRDIVLLAIGDGPLWQEMQTKYSREMNRAYIAPGFVNQSELGRYFMSADAFVLPSIYDTWGLVVNEAMQFGIPCVVSDRVGSRRDLIEPFESGLIFAHDKASDLESCLLRLMDNPSQLQVMSINAARAVSGHTTQIAAERISSAVSVTLQTLDN